MSNIYIYICPTALYLLSMLFHAYNIIVDHGVGATYHIRDVVGVININNNKIL